MIEKGDIVKTQPLGWLARVNWIDYESQKAGVTYYEGTVLSQGHNVREVTDIELVKKGVKQFFQREFEQYSEDMLRALLKGERGVRATPPTEPERKVRSDSRVRELVGELTEEEQREFLEMMKQKKGD